VTKKKGLARCGAAVMRMVASALFRPRCRLCGLDLVQPGEKVICADCRQKLRPAAENRCRTCGRFIPDAVERCGACRLQAPPFQRHGSYAAYEGTLREVIILYKYGEVEPLKIMLAALCLETLARELPGPFDAVVPVPADRCRRHGFMPVQAMARVLARELKTGFRPRLLRKIRSTRPQVGLSRAQREKNLDGAFILAQGKKLAGKRILLVDDVITTGTTIRSCAALLSRRGARVTAVTLAQSRF
jgi:ComF family protein